MVQLNPHRTGLALGALFGLWHLLWSVLVAIGVAQAILHFILSLHFIDIAFSMREFEVIIASELIVVTSLVGYLLGYIFAKVWNGLMR